MRIPTILTAACLLLVSCQQEEGCTDPAATNYDPNAVEDDGSCEYDNDPGNPGGGGGGSMDEPTIDGYTYDVVTIGEQVWFAENLRTTVYANGDVIPAGLTDGEWTSTTAGATAVYGEGSSYCENNSPNIDACDEVQSLAEYGRLYNWYAVDDTRGLCPAGWHVPTNGEWTELEDYITSQGFASTVGTALKSTSGWYNNGNGTDDFGFSALPGGARDFNSGNFDSAGGISLWWSSSPFGGLALGRFLNSGSPSIIPSSTNPRSGVSVRCLRDAGISVVQGCTDPSAMNYNPEATEDDGSCYYDDEPTIDGYTYDVVTIGEQVWFAENLRTTVYANGDPIPAGLTDGEWTTTTAGATAVYGEGNSYCENYSPDIDACDEAQSLAEYGRLYNWYAVDDARGLCPAGWHVPTDEEWTELEDFITSQGFDGTEGTALKSTSGWTEEFGGGNGTDDFGFSALPGGYRDASNGYFYSAGDFGIWWSSSPNGGVAWYRSLVDYDPGIGRDVYDPRGGFSVRCLRDAE